MTELTIRRLLIDLEAPIDRHWNGGDAFRTAFFNALSMSFPAGEQFFIDALRAGVKELPPERREALEVELRGFVGQEATHRRIHALFNRQIEAHGLHNHWEPRIQRRLKRLDGLPSSVAVAATAATEHFTAIFADWLLRDAKWLLHGTEPRLRTLWIWHACEEIEHRSTAMDVYRAMQGSEKWRRHLMRLVTFHFLTDLLRQTLHNLWRDGSLWKWNTWRSGWTMVFSNRGMVPRIFGPWRQYFQRDFHPSGPTASDPTNAQQWLVQNALQYKVVAGQTART